MGVFDTIKRELNQISRPYEDDEPETAVAEEEEEEQQPISLDAERSRREEAETAELEEEYIPFPTLEPKQPERVVPLGGSSQNKLVMVCPSQFSDTGAVVEQLRQKRTIVLNLEKTDDETTKRILDVVSGAAYALEGKVKRVSKKIFVVAPYHMDILTVTMDDLKNASIINLNIPQ